MHMHMHMHMSDALTRCCRCFSYFFVLISLSLGFELSPDSYWILIIIFVSGIIVRTAAHP